MNLKAGDPEPLHVMLLCGIATVIFELVLLGALQVLRWLT